MNTVQKRLLSHFKARWNKARRIRDRFVSKNSAWLDGEIKMQLDESMKMEIEAHGDHLEKLEKCNNIELAQEYIPDYVHNAYVHGLKYEGKPNHYHDAIFTFYPIYIRKTYWINIVTKSVPLIKNQY